jgi:hypothetical protein
MHEEESADFAQYEEGLYALYAGKYVLIKGRRLIGVYDRSWDAIREFSIQQFGLIRYLGPPEHPEGFCMPGSDGHSDFQIEDPILGIRWILSDKSLHTSCCSI